MKQDGRNAAFRFLHAKNDKETIVAWKLDLSRVLQVFNVRSFCSTPLLLTSPFQTELAINTHVMVSDIRRDVSKIRKEAGGQVHSVSANSIHSRWEDAYFCPGSNQVRSFDYHENQCLIFTSSVPGESPPPPPRVCIGRDELIAKIVGLAKNLTPIALIGAGGIGKTSIALTVLHHDLIKKRFGDNRRFIRCDQFHPSRAHFLSRLSKVIGAGIANPEDLTPLRPFLSSRKMLLILDNAESILDPQGTHTRGIYPLVEELSRFETVCLCITSRISTVPRHCKRPTIAPLSMESACDIFYDIYDNGGRSDIISDLLRRLDFHTLSITLLATTASHNMWSYDRLAREWDARRMEVLRTDHNESVAATIELSLASPTFRKLGPLARDLLGVIAFFPQGVDEENLHWLFPTTSNRKQTFDKFCVLSLTYRSDGYITMLAPLRNYLYPKDPASSPLLCVTKDRYLSRLSVDVEPGRPGFEEAKWIRSEDVNVEHLLDGFTSVDVNSVGVWDACGHFMEHLYWHKTRLVVLGPKIEALPDDHHSKPQCVFQLSRLYYMVGNYLERKRLLTHALKLWRERGEDFQVARTLRFLSGANRQLGLHDEGMQKAREALKIYKRLDNIPGQAQSWESLAQLLYHDKQLDAAEEATSRAINLLSDKNEQFVVCGCHSLLGDIYRSRGRTEEAIGHFETILGIASPFNWHDQLFWAHYSLAKLIFAKKRFEDAHAHVDRAKLHAANDTYCLGCAMKLEARFWYKQRRFQVAKSAVLHAADLFEKLGDTKRLEACRANLRKIEKATNKPPGSRR